MSVYVGIALVALTALPAVGERDLAGAQLPRGADAGHRRQLRRRTGSPTALTYVIAAAATATLVAAANSAMLGLSRLAYSLATNRQIPGGIGRLHPTRSTPYVLIASRPCWRRRWSCRSTSTS